MSVSEMISFSHEKAPSGHPKPHLEGHALWVFNNTHLPEQGQFNPHNKQRYDLYDEIASHATPFLLKDPLSGRVFGAHHLTPPEGVEPKGLIVEGGPFMVTHSNPAYLRDMGAVVAETGHEMVAYEFMGHGRSQRVGRRIAGHIATGNFSHFAHELWRALDTTDPAASSIKRTQSESGYPLSVCGVSLGGRTALALLAHDPKPNTDTAEPFRRIDGLVVVDPAGTIDQKPLDLLHRYARLGAKGAASYIEAAKQRGASDVKFEMSAAHDPFVYWLTTRRSAAAGTGTSDLRAGLYQHPETRAFVFHAGSSEINQHAGRLAFNAAGATFGERFSYLIGPGDTHALTNGSSQRVGTIYARGLEMSGIATQPVR